MKFIFEVVVFLIIFLVNVGNSSDIGVINVADPFLPDPETRTVFNPNPLVESFTAYKQAKAAAATASGTNYQPVAYTSATAPQENRAIFGSVGLVPAPSVGISVNTGNILQPQAEILRLVEAFIRLKAELLGRFQVLYNDNFDLIHNLTNLLLGKLSKLSLFTLNGISILRSILEFAANLFANWNFTIPSVTIGGNIGGYPRPHETYGVPPEAQTINSFLHALAH